MQFTGHSLPVHQSMSVPWEFFCSSHFISQFPPTRFPLITAIRMCHLLPVHHLGMAFLAGSKGQNITLRAQALCLALALTTASCPQLRLQLELDSACLALQLQLLEPSVAPGYIIVCLPPASGERRICTEFNPSTGQGDILTPSTGCPCFL